MRKSLIPGCWLDRRVTCAMFGLAEHRLRQVIEPQLPADAKKSGAKNKVLLDGAAVFKVLVEELTDSDAVVLSGKGGDLENAYMEEKVRKIRMENEARENNLLNRNEIHQCFSVMGRIIRRAGEQLQKRFGREAHSLLDVALDNCERELCAVAGKEAQ